MANEQDTSKFNVRKFLPNSDQQLVDTSDLLGNNGLTISFLHVPSNRCVYFKAFITAFNETYNSNWNKEEVFGRSDPIVGFKNTTRKISLAFKIPSATHSEGYENLARVQSLIQFLYPVYTDVQNALSISESPLLRLKVMNLAANQDGQDGGTFNDFREMGSLTGKSASRGLLGFPSSITVNHNLNNFETSGMELGPAAGGRGNPPNILPRLIEVNLDFTVIHEHHLGWRQGEDGEGKVFDQKPFPYGLDFQAPVVDKVSLSDGLSFFEKSFEQSFAETERRLEDGDFEGPIQPQSLLNTSGISSYYGVSALNPFGMNQNTAQQSLAAASADNQPPGDALLNPVEVPSGGTTADTAGQEQTAAELQKAIGK